MQQILLAVLLVLEVLCSFLLIGVILLQKSKGGGLSGTAFGGGGGDSLFGARTGNVLTKITITLSIFFLANTLLLAFMYAGPKDRSVMDSRKATDIRPVEPTPLPAEAPLPVVPGPQDMPVAPDAGTPPIQVEMPSLEPRTVTVEAPAPAPAPESPVADELAPAPVPASEPAVEPTPAPESN